MLIYIGNDFPNGVVGLGGCGGLGGGGVGLGGCGGLTGPGPPTGGLS